MDDVEFEQRKQDLKARGRALLELPAAAAAPPQAAQPSAPPEDASAARRHAGLAAQREKQEKQRLPPSKKAKSADLAPKGQRGIFDGIFAASGFKAATVHRGVSIPLELQPVQGQYACKYASNRCTKRFQELKAVRSHERFCPHRGAPPVPADEEDEAADSDSAAARRSKQKGPMQPLPPAPRLAGSVAEPVPSGEAVQKGVRNASRPPRVGTLIR